MDTTDSREQLIGAAAGSLFVFKGKYKAVLISYPTADEKKKLFTDLTGFNEKLQL